jgi:hypothetical protein
MAWLLKTYCYTVFWPNERARLDLDQNLIPREQRSDTSKARAQSSVGGIIGFAEPDDRQLLAG